MPSHTGKRGGDQTGYKMSHFVLRGGLYEKSFSELEKLGGKISWIESIVSLSIKIVPPVLMKIVPFMYKFF